MNKLLTKKISLYSALPKDIFNLDTNKKLELRKVVDEHIKTSAVKPLARRFYHHTAITEAFKYVTVLEKRHTPVLLFSYVYDLISRQASSLKQDRKCIICIEIEEEELRVKPRFRHQEALPRFNCVSDRTYVVCGRYFMFS